jgi:hypothetical protein
MEAAILRASSALPGISPDIGSVADGALLEGQ